LEKSNAKAGITGLGKFLTFHYTGEGHGLMMPCLQAGRFSIHYSVSLFLLHCLSVRNIHFVLNLVLALVLRVLPMCLAG
jgi:hypothetical protein